MVVQTRLLIITVRDRNYTFRVRIHKTESPVEQMIEAPFYEEFAGKIHEGVHHEMELVESPVLGRINPDVPIHVHQNPDSKLYFVCFTGNIATLETALSVLRLWCVGTVYAMTHNEDFGPLAKEYGARFLDAMRDRCSIVISGDMELPQSTMSIGEKGITQAGATEDCEDGNILRI